MSETKHHCPKCGKEPAGMETTINVLFEIEDGVLTISGPDSDALSPPDSDYCKFSCDRCDFAWDVDEDHFKRVEYEA